MIKTILPFLFGFCSLSAGNRLILQAPPTIPPPPAVMEPPANMLPGGMVTPGANPSAPAPASVPPSNIVSTPGSAPGAQPAAPAPPAAAPAQPSLPVVPNHGTPGAPIGGGGGPSTVTPPGTGGSVTNPNPWNRPQATNPQFGLGGNRLECVKTPTATDPGCSGQIITVNNPNLNWECKASGLGSMYKTTINIDYAQFSMAPEELKGFWSTAEYAMAGATININNNSGRTIRIAELRCEKDFSCQDLTIYTGSDAFIEQGDCHCNTYLACQNCWIKENPMDVGLPCTAYVEPI